MKINSIFSNYMALSSISQFIKESVLQLRLMNMSYQQVHEIVVVQVEKFHELKNELEKNLESPLNNKCMLEIGHGQMPLRCAFFTALSNNIIGIDLDASPQRFSLLAYLSILRSSGFRRMIKTAGREILGINQNYRKAFRHIMNLSKYPTLDLRRMDACNRFELDDSCIDVAISFDVFEHLPDPRTTLIELKRVIKPGGIALLQFVHYGFYNALHDLRMTNIESTTRPYWGHLRKRYKDSVQQRAYVNDIRLNEWRKLVDEILPDAKFIRIPLTQKRALKELEEIRKNGECLEYSDDELLTDRIKVIWKRV